MKGPETNIDTSGLRNPFLLDNAENNRIKREVEADIASAVGGSPLDDPETWSRMKESPGVGQSFREIASRAGKKYEDLTPEDIETMRGAETMREAIEAVKNRTQSPSSPPEPPGAPVSPAASTVATPDNPPDPTPPEVPPPGPDLAEIREGIRGEVEAERTPEEKNIDEGIAKKFEADFRLAEDELNAIKTTVTENGKEREISLADLTPGQQAVLLKNLKQFALENAEEQGLKSFTEKEKERIGSSGRLMKMWYGATKTFRRAKNMTEAEQALLGEGGKEIHKEALQEMLGAAFEGPEVEIVDGKEKIRFALSRDFGESLPGKVAVERFNQTAEKLGALDQDLLVSGKESDRKKYEETKAAYDDARGKLLLLKAQGGKEDDAVAYITDLDKKVQYTQLFNTHPGTEKMFANALTKNRFWEAAKAVLAEKGKTMAMSGAIRTVGMAGAGGIALGLGFTAPLGVALLGGAGVGSIAGGWIGRYMAGKRAKLESEDTAKLAQLGVENRLSGHMAQAEKEVTLKDTAGNTREESVGLGAKLDRLSEPFLEGTKNENWTKELLGEGESLASAARQYAMLDERVKYTEQKMQEDLVNMGEGPEALRRRYELAASLAKARTIRDLYTPLDAGKGRRTNRMERLESLLKEEVTDINKNETDIQKASKRQGMKYGAILGGIFGTLIPGGRALAQGLEESTGTVTGGAPTNAPQLDANKAPTGQEVAVTGAGILERATRSAQEILNAGKELPPLERLQKVGEALLRNIEPFSPENQKKITDFLQEFAQKYPALKAPVEELTSKFAKSPTQAPVTATGGPANVVENTGIPQKPNAPSPSDRFPSPHYIDYALGEPKLPGMQSDDITEQIEKLGNIQADQQAAEAGLPPPEFRPTGQEAVSIESSVQPPIETKAYPDWLGTRPLTPEEMTGPSKLTLEEMTGTDSSGTKAILGNQVPGKSSIGSAVGAEGKPGTQSGTNPYEMWKRGAPRVVPGEELYASPKVFTNAINNAELGAGKHDSIWGSSRQIFEQNAKELGFHGDVNNKAELRAWAEKQTANTLWQNEKAGKNLVHEGDQVRITRNPDGKSYSLGVEYASGKTPGVLPEHSSEMGGGNRPAGGEGVGEHLSVTPKHTPYFDSLFGVEGHGKDYPIETLAAQWRDIYAELRFSKTDLQKFGLDKFLENGFGRKVKELPLDIFLKGKFDQSILANGGLNDTQSSHLFDIVQRIANAQTKIMLDGGVLHDNNTKVGDLLMGNDQLLRKGPGIWGEPKPESAPAPVEHPTPRVIPQAPEATPVPQKTQAPEVLEQPQPKPAHQPEQQLPVPESPRAANENSLFDQGKIDTAEARWTLLAERSPGGNIFLNREMQPSLNEDVHAFVGRSNYAVQLHSRADDYYRVALRDLVSSIRKSHPALEFPDGPERVGPGERITVKEYLQYADNFLRAYQTEGKILPPLQGLS